QRIVYEAIRRGVLERHLPELRAHYRHKRDVMVQSLKRAFGGDIRWSDPRGGFFLWATLPHGLDAESLLDRAVQHGVIYVAGSAFYVEPGDPGAIRLSFSAPTPARIEEGVDRLAAAIRETVSGPGAESTPLSPAAP